ncbi:uncharacterized protein [Musca autumnalis]|uniref:uncharacterized protein n=1 Tax=Musca autumnalis TaxID=221902 RepID=UPI003CEF6D0F
MTDENVEIPPEQTNEVLPINVNDGENKELQANEQGNELILLEEQFDNYMRIAKSLMKTLRRPRDIEICGDLLRKVQKLNTSRHVEVRTNNNRFFRYCLKVLKWTSENQPLELYRQLYSDDGTTDEGVKEITQWLSDKQSYIAEKTYKNGVSLIYMAVANDVEAGWQKEGFKILQEKLECERD